MGRLGETGRPTRHPVRPGLSAAERYAAALDAAPSVGDHLRIPGSQRFATGVNEAWALLEEAVALDPSFAPAHAARGNVLLRGGFLDDARAAYLRAAELDPHAAAPRYALAEIANLVRDEPTAQRWFDAAFARARLFSPPRPLPGARHALVLGLAGPWPRNIPLDFLIDEQRWTLHRWFLPDDDEARALPPVDLIVNALGQTDAGAAAIAQCARVLAARAVPSINAPARLAGVARDALAATLAGIPGVVVPAARRVSRAQVHDAARAADADALGGIAYPLLLRPLDSHGGRGLERLDGPAQLPAYLERNAAPAYDAAAYVDYRSADGWFRKYRVVFVDGVPFAYHLAIDEHWMIHYYRTPTGSTDWMRAEEVRFISAPDEVLRGWNDTLPRIATALGLDYAGIDCGQLPDGRLVIFEADPTMLVHGFDAADGGLRRANAQRIGDALQSLFERRAGRA